MLQGNGLRHPGVTSAALSSAGVSGSVRTVSERASGQTSRTELRHDSHQGFASVDRSVIHPIANIAQCCMDFIIMWRLISTLVSIR
jgi:hypothetical protein